ncbi:MAG: Wzz/FepE/Etk N-terminal domain-containing protein [Pseudomonadota bacterium]
MSRVEILRFIFKRKYSIFVTFALVVSVTVGLLYLIPPVFGATASVLVERNRAPNMRTQFQPGLEMIEVINTEAHLAISQTVLVAAVDALKPYERTTPPSSFKIAVENFRKKMDGAGLVTYLEPRDRWIRRLSKSVVSKPVPNSNVLEITYFDEDPQRAADIVNAIVQAYLTARDDIYRTSGEVLLYTAQLEDVTARIASRRSELDDIRAAISETSRDSGARSLDLQADSLNRELVTVRRELDELSTRFQPEHPRIVSVQARIDDVQAKLDDTLARMEQETLLTARTDQLSMLIEADTQTFRSLKTRLDDAELSEIADQQLRNVRRVDIAQAPNKPRFERLILIILSIPLGLFLGFAIAFIREYFDDSVENLREAETALGVPGFGSVARFGMFTSVAR